MKNVIFIPLICFFPAVVLAQSNAQWPFYLAFEDATGASDTIWLVMDETADFPDLDPEFGEETIELSENDFNVWMNIYQNEGDFKCFAIQLYGYQEQYIFGSNYTHPIIVKWDSSLFHADILYQVLGQELMGL